MTRHAYVDSSIALYAAGRSSSYRESSRRIMSLAQSGELRLHASVEVIQEFVFHRIRISDRELALEEAADLAALITLHDFDREVLGESLRLMRTTSVRGRDAVHAATALVHGITDIVSPDRVFDDVPGLIRLDPADV